MYIHLLHTKQSLFFSPTAKVHKQCLHVLSPSISLIRLLSQCHSVYNAIHGHPIPKPRNTVLFITFDTHILLLLEIMFGCPWCHSLVLSFSASFSCNPHMLVFPKSLISNSSLDDTHTQSGQQSHITNPFYLDVNRYP